MVAALYGGEVQAAFLGPVQGINLIKDGRLRALAVTGQKRLAQMPNVPTMAESGYPSYDLDGGIQAAVYAPAKTPREIILKLNREINAVLEETAVKERFASFALEGAGGPPEELDRQLTSKMQKYASIVKAAKIEPE
jgi:tripartite-type tricarboxylate transporter receptor subunit TctC